MSKMESLFLMVVLMLSGCSEKPCDNPTESQRDLACEAGMKARGMTILRCGGCWRTEEPTK
jgi:hypothetical protein